MVVGLSSDWSAGWSSGWSAGWSSGWSAYCFLVSGPLLVVSRCCSYHVSRLASSGVFSTAKGAFFDCYGGFLRPLRELSSTATEAFFDCYGSFLRLLWKLSSTATGAFFDCYMSIFYYCGSFLVVCFWAASSFLVALLFVAGFVSISSPFVSRWFLIFGSSGWIVVIIKYEVKLGFLVKDNY